MAATREIGLEITAEAAVVDGEDVEARPRIEIMQVMTKPLTIRKCRGMALIMTLWITAILALIISVTVRTTRQETLLTRNENESVRGKWALRAGIEYALSVLAEDDDSCDTLTDSWAEAEDEMNSYSMTGPLSGRGLTGTATESQPTHQLQLAGCLVTVRIYDEAAKLNVNTATIQQLRNLPGMTREAAAALMDWRDEDNKITGGGGAERKHYLSLAYPYQIRNGLFKTVGELLEVEGIDRGMFYGEDTNLNRMLDYNENDGLASGPMDNEDDFLDQGLVAWLTCYTYDKNEDSSGEARININKADEKQLQNKLDLRPAYAKWIVDNRGGGFGSVTDLIRNPSRETDPDPESRSTQPAELDIETFVDIIDRITVSDEERVMGLVNVNTASREVLTALFNGDGGLADKVIEAREVSVQGFGGIGELLTQGGLEWREFKKIADLITVRSQVFMVECQTQSTKTGVKRTAWAVIDRDQEKILSMYYQ